MHIHTINTANAIRAIALCLAGALPHSALAAQDAPKSRAEIVAEVKEEWKASERFESFIQAEQGGHIYMLRDQDGTIYVSKDDNERFLECKHDSRCKSISLCVADNGDVFVLGQVGVDLKVIAAKNIVWKNGAVYQTTENTQRFETIKVVGNNVFVAGSGLPWGKAMGSPKPTLWMNKMILEQKKK